MRLARCDTFSDDIATQMSICKLMRLQPGCNLHCRLLASALSHAISFALQGVYLISATNRPDMIDPALLRPGRLDKILYVPLPGPADRAAILSALTRRTPLAADVNIAAIGTADACAGYSGADLAALVREACILALKVQPTC